MKLLKISFDIVHGYLSIGFREVVAEWIKAASVRSDRCLRMGPNPTSATLKLCVIRRVAENHLHVTLIPKL